MKTIDLWQTAREDKENEIYKDLIIRRGDNDSNKPTLKIWRGKALRPYANYYYRSLEDRDKAITREKELTDKRTTRQEEEKTKKAEFKKSYVPTLVEGDILVGSWGYEQTNIDFYVILSIKGKKLVIQEIGQDRFETGWCQETVKPDRTQLRGKPMTKILQAREYKGTLFEYYL